MMRLFIFITCIIVFLVALLGTQVHCADFCATFGNYDDQIKRKLGIDPADTTLLPDTVTHDRVREAVIALMPIMQGDKITDSITTSYKQSHYSLDSLMEGVNYVIWSKNDSVKSLLYLPQNLWYQKEPRTTVGKKGYDLRPSYYDYTDDQIFLYPTPSNAGDTIKIYGYASVSDIAAKDSLHIIPQKYRPTVLLYSTFLCAEAIGSPLTNSLYTQFQQMLDVTRGRVVKEDSGN